MIAPTMMFLQPARQATRSQAITACRKLNQSASAATGSMMHGGEVGAKEKFLEHFQRESSFREDLVYSLSFAGNSLESDLESDNTVPLIDDHMKRLLRNSYKALTPPYDCDAQKLRSRLPPQFNLGNLEALDNVSIKRNLPPLQQDDEEIIAENYAHPIPIGMNQISVSKLDQDSRAIVVTDTKNPYRIVAVNTAWENLCGYTREECKGRSVGGLLQGPETDTDNVMALLSKLLAGEEADAMLTNYTKNGRKFQNKIKVGPVKDDMGKTVNFVGVLQEVKTDENLSTANVGGRMQLPFMS